MSIDERPFTPHDWAPDGTVGEVYLTEHDTDQERMWIALSEVGLQGTENGGGWLGWDRELSQDEYDLVVKAEQLARTTSGVTAARAEVQR